VCQTMTTTASQAACGGLVAHRDYLASATARINPPLDLADISSRRLPDSGTARRAAIGIPAGVNVLAHS